jgi:hypothetical protein
MHLQLWPFVLIFNISSRRRRSTASPYGLARRGCPPVPAAYATAGDDGPEPRHNPGLRAHRPSFTQPEDSHDPHDFRRTGDLCPARRHAANRPGPIAGRQLSRGSVWLFGGNFCPRGTAEANGQLLSIEQNQALFSIFGTMYGGDGRTTFALPDLRGRSPVSQGQGPGLVEHPPRGQKGGARIRDLEHGQHARPQPRRDRDDQRHRGWRQNGFPGPTRLWPSQVRTIYSPRARRPPWPATAATVTQQNVGGNQPVAVRAPFSGAALLRDHTRASTRRAADRGAPGPGAPHPVRGLCRRPIPAPAAFSLRRRRLRLGLPCLFWANSAFPRRHPL